MPNDLVVGTPGYDADLYNLGYAITKGLQLVCEEVCVPLHKFFAKARVTHVKLMPIDWNKKSWYGSQFELEYTHDVQLIAGVSPSGFLVGVYVSAMHSK